MKKLLFIFGTRPEAIKLAPLIIEFKKHPEDYEVRVCVTAQHREMLDQVLEFFHIKPDYDLNIMKPHQTLFDITAEGLKALEKVMKLYQPNLVFVQGDTTTSFIGALAAYYSSAPSALGKKIHVAHVEAGLRSGNKYSPFPEEMNRVMAGHLSDYHFAPTPTAVRALKKENITGNVFNVGNTVIDALFLGLEIINSSKFKVQSSKFGNADLEKRIVLITGHRRESFGTPFENICNAIKETASTFNDVEFIYPVHLNPNVQQPVHRLLGGLKNVHLIEPLDYPHFIWLMNKSYIILTDSGGLQEEAPSLGKPVLVMRDVTERQEGVDAGTAKLVGTDRQLIVSELERLLTHQSAYEQMAHAVNPYGDGTACKQIVDRVSAL